MESSLSLLPSQTSRAERPIGRARESEGADAAGDPGGFARALTEATSTEAAPDGPAAAAAQEAGDRAAMPVQPGSAGARTASHRVLDGADAVDAAGQGGAQDAVARSPLRPARADDGDPPAASDTASALVQWMMQLPLAPQPPAAPVRGGPDPQGAAAQKLSARSAMPLDRSDPASREAGAAFAGVVMSGSREAGPGAGKAVGTTTATGLGEGPSGVAIPVKTGTWPDTGASAHRGEPASRPPLAMAAPGGAVAAAAEGARAAIPSEPRGTAVSASDVLAVLPSAAQAAAAAAAATAVATPAGSPVPAPGQTWIQTPVTQPGFSDEVVVALVRDVGQAEQGAHALTLHLNPEELGPVSVSIELQGTAARIAFTASEALTRHHLEAALPALTQALQDQGVSLTEGGVHEASKESLAASAAGSQTSGGTGSDARQRSDAPFDGRSGYGERAPRWETEVFSVDGRAMAESRAPLANGPSPGRAGRLDLFA
ncbi:flagellar hook-length control protein FliK [Sphaerotilus sp.]|uniref:flagellar hook-length control protein FliK n=1 Tax=Sphaerotilus sp. TaxID=2093942 RepID=UPI002ACE7988|nr:flagellar hook-length control protein FliK [Sphaerotilus sp.]MDZ7857645.1 flagellar hook-length control protein FliK [Sphaerotilus sp.]